MMMRRSVLAGLVAGIWCIPGPCLAQPALPPEMAAKAATNYQRYCALCHGPDRAGYANDDAPSLKSRQLFAAGFPLDIYNAVAYGRRGTAMAAYLDELGGPLSQAEIGQLLVWLLSMVVQEKGEFPIDAVMDPEVRNRPVAGDIDRGREIFAAECTQCHGPNGQGGTAPAVGNPVFLANSTDAFIRHSIANGREDTPMAAYAGVLSVQDIDAVTAFLRSRATGWSKPSRFVSPPVSVPAPPVNPEGASPSFDLRDGLYVTVDDLHAGLADGRKVILLDARVMSAWASGHIPGAFPAPYYADEAALLEAVPHDGTWIVVYCECPRAAAEQVVKRLRTQGMAHTAVLYEGFHGWAAKGFPVEVGLTTGPGTEQADNSK